MQKKAILINHDGLPILMLCVTGRTLQPSTESVTAIFLVPSDFLVNGQVSGLGTVHPFLILSFISTWILPILLVFHPLLICVQSPSTMELWMTGADS